MPDLLDPLARLRDASPTDPEPVDALRARTARRRRRKRAVLGVCGALVAAVVTAVTLQGLRDDDEVGLIVDQPITTATTPTTSTASTVPAPITIGELPGGYVRVISGPDGITVAAPTGNPPLRRLTDRPTSIAFGVGEGRVVAQYATSGVVPPIVVLDEGGERQITAPAFVDAGGGMRLLDAGFVDGRPVAVISAYGGANPEQWQERLLVVDLDTLEQHDLGASGGWERGVSDAAVLPDGDVVLLESHIGGNELERRRADGTTAWSTPVSGGDLNRSMALHRDRATGAPSAILVVETSAEVGTPLELRARQYDLETGVEPDAEHDAVALRPEPGLAIDSLLCGHAEHGGTTTLLCNQVTGPPIRIDYVDGGVVRETGAPDDGTMTVWRQSA